MSDRIWVPDSSALIQMKRSITVANQWDAFKAMETMVDRGEIALARHVIREVSEIMHPDVPGAWTSGMRPKVQHPLDPDYEHVSTVMGCEAAKVVDPEKEKEDADPYVIALALQLMEEGKEPMVVTRDCVDHLPLRIAMTTACAHVDAPCCHLDDFLEAVGVKFKRSKEE